MNHSNLSFSVSVDGGDHFDAAPKGVRVTVHGLTGSAPASLDFTLELTKKEAEEQALYWMEAGAANPGKATPDVILKSIRKALGNNPDEPVNEFQAFTIAGKKNFFVTAFSVEDGLEDPEFALIEIDQQWLNLVSKLKATMEQNTFLTEVRACDSITWRPNEGSEELYDEPLSITEIVVYRYGFWFRSAGKHGGAIETRIVSWSLLKWITEQHETVIYQPTLDIEPTIEGGNDLKQLIEDVWASHSDSTNA